MRPAPTPITETEYLARERLREARHEFVEGVEYAMAGASGAHSDLVLRLGAALLRALETRGCNVRAVDQRLKPGTRYYYPDLVVYCGKAKTEDDGFNTLLDATVVIEVLSPTTEGIDRGEKFEAYQQLSSFREYVLVDPRRVRVERFSRQDDGSWRIDVLGAGAVLELGSVGASCAVDEIYRGVELEPLVRLA